MQISEYLKKNIGSVCTETTSIEPRVLQTWLEGFQSHILQSKQLNSLLSRSASSAALYLLHSDIV